MKLTIFDLDQTLVDFIAVHDEPDYLFSSLKDYRKDLRAIDRTVNPNG